MATFYRNALLALMTLIAFSAITIAVGAALMNRKTPLLPGTKSQVPWFHSTVPMDTSGENKVLVKSNGQDTNKVEFDFRVSTKEDNPYTSFIFYLADPKSVSDLVDLRGYSEIRFKVRCKPKNTLVFAMYTYVDGVTDLNRPETFRVSLSFLKCTSTTSTITFPLAGLDSADWWLSRYGLSYTNRESDLKHVHGFALNNSLQSPRGIQSNIEVKDLALITKDQRFLFASIGLTLIAWLAGIYWLIKNYVREQLQVANEKINTNRPLVAYQKLSVKQTSDDLDSRLLRYIAVEYTNPDINIEDTAATLGTTRPQINKILKAELGLTFTSYINKLRLTEASRLLRDEPSMGIKQVALGVGFANVTYFNVLFKKEYGCTPKMIRQNGSYSEQEDNPPSPNDH